jgi:phosphohistidine swiveling domain-containing protein
MGVDSPENSPDTWDPLHTATDTRTHWTRANVGEAVAGVQTPLSWTVWQRVSESCAREALFRIGALSRRERRVPVRPEDRAVRIFLGRCAMRVDFLTTLGDRMPGTTGQATASAIFGSVPDDIEFRPTRRRYAVVAWRFPWTFATSPSACRRFAAETDGWYRDRIARTANADAGEALELFREAADRFVEAVILQTVALMAVVQPLYDVLGLIVDRAGIGDPSVLSGSGGAEMAVIGDIWGAAHNRIGVETVATRHGFHGPLEGELSSEVWRENDAPLRGMMRHYAGRPCPRTKDDVDLVGAQREVLSRFPLPMRSIVRRVLALAASRIPLRGLVKRSFLQAFDVARASARRYGAMAQFGEPDDVFFVTFDELVSGRIPDPAVIAKRRARWESYRGIDLPESWTGVPRALRRRSDDATTLSGKGASPGTVDGTAYVVTDPSFADVEPDHILIAHTTDPSWSSIMFVSAALVTDIGGPMSHAAVVARELGIPCVVGTKTATVSIRTGDHVRVDGTAGTVEVLERPVNVAD